MAEDRIDVLIRQFGSRDDDVRLNAFNALVKIGKPAIPALIDALKGEDEELLWIGDARAVPGLVDALKNWNATVRWKAAEVLRKIIPVLTEPSLGETEKMFRKSLEKAEGKEKKVLVNWLEELNNRRNVLFEPEVKKLKPPKIIRKRKKPKRRMWRTVRG